jgi:GTP-binding protein Era
METKNHKSGFIAISGRPNVGKSTLLNSILKEKISAVSSKPNTTRNRILGIHTSDDFQMVFLDTPGIHTPKDKLNKFMVNQAYTSFEEADIICFLVESGEKAGFENNEIIENLKRYNTPKILVVNKSDKANAKISEETKELFISLLDFSESVIISALNPSDINVFLEKIKTFLPVQEAFFPDDIITDSSERFIVSEIIREKLFLQTGDELPYACAVEVISFKEDDDIIRIEGVINVERDSQKGMIIGKGGKTIKNLGIASRADIEKLLFKKVFLKLSVRVDKNWSKDDRKLKKFGYSE